MEDGSAAPRDTFVSLQNLPGAVRHNRYSVAASAVGRPVEIRAYADRIELRQDGRLVGEHCRCFGRDQTVFDPWHYVPVLARKPGALRNGAPFKDWVLPTGLQRIRRKPASAADGDRQVVNILIAVLSDGLPAVEAACQEALRDGVHSADVVINILARQWVGHNGRRNVAPNAVIQAKRVGLRGKSRRWWSSGFPQLMFLVFNWRKASWAAGGSTATTEPSTVVPVRGKTPTLCRLEYSPEPKMKGLR